MNFYSNLSLKGAKVAGLAATLMYFKYFVHRIIHDKNSYCCSYCSMAVKFNNVLCIVYCNIESTRNVL